MWIIFAEFQACTGRIRNKAYIVKTAIWMAAEGVWSAAWGGELYKETDMQEFRPGEESDSGWKR